MVGEADSVNSVSASACHIGGPKGVTPGQKAFLRGNGEWEVWGRVQGVGLVVWVDTRLMVRAPPSVMGD